MSDPNDPQVVYTLGLFGPSGLPISWQGALPITPAQSPYSAAILQPVAVDCRLGAVTVQLPALVDSSTCVVAIKDLYGASATHAITVLPVSGLGTLIEVPGSLGTYASTTTIASNGAVIWFVAMFSVNSWVIWVN
jgi:hypothetical protein